MLEFAEPWHECTDDGLVKELHRETCEQHVLYGVDARVIASRQDQDDFLFELPDGRFALVHLTWKQESNPDFPFTHVYETAEDAQAAIQHDAEEWQALRDGA